MQACSNAIERRAQRLIAQQFHKARQSIAQDVLGGEADPDRQHPPKRRYRDTVGTSQIIAKLRDDILHGPGTDPGAGEI